MQSLLKNRTLIFLILLCGIVMLAGIVLVTKKELKDKTKRIWSDMVEFKSTVPTQSTDSIEADLKNSDNHMIQNGKEWRTGAEIHITY